MPLDAIPSLKYLHTNNASSNLAVAITASTTSVQVSPGQGVLFPNPAVGQGAFITIEDRRIGRLEIVLCSARSGDTLTVVRGQQGTVPIAFDVGSNVSNRVTAGILDFFIDRAMGVLDVTQLPMIPDSKLIGMAATKLTGTIDGARLPNIPPAKMVGVYAGNLVTGPGADQKLSTSVLPATIPNANLPVIDPTKLTTVHAGNVKQGPGTNEKLSTGVLPVIPSALITSVDSDALTGTIPSARIAGSYSGFSNIGGTGNSTFTRFYANVAGPANPSYSFQGAQTSGHYFSEGSQGVVTSIAGQAKLMVSDFRVTAFGGAAFEGSGAFITNINATNLATGTVDPARLPTSPAERTRIQANLADMSIGQIGTYAFLRNMTGTIQNPGDTASGSNLRYAQSDDSYASSPVPPGTWRCLGACEGGKASLFIRT